MSGLTNPNLSGKPRATATDTTAAARWDNEGGTPPAPAHAAPPDPLLAVTPLPLTPAASSALDKRQVEIMADESADGRPPSRWGRIAGWRTFGIGAVLILAAIIAVVAIRGISATYVAAGIGLMVLLLIGASPVLGAGLMRGSEERTARRHARLERRARRGR